MKTKNRHRKSRWVWSFTLVLFVCVAASSYGLISRLNGFLLDDTGAIPLAPKNSFQTPNQNTSNEDPQGTEGTTPTEQTEETMQPSVSPNEPNSSVTTPNPTEPPKKPGFEAGDDKTVWTTNTHIDIFRVSYVNGEQYISVNSDNGDKVIAPGTENSYTFKLKNTGNVALDYTVTVDAYFTPGDIFIPITGRLNRYDGKWVIGDSKNFVKASELDLAEDSATLGAGKYTYYTLDWLWPFESGDDTLDTLLGNMATEEDLVFTIVIKTTATESIDSSNTGGITPPQTGDNRNIILWIFVAAISFILLVLLTIYQRKEEMRMYAEAENIGHAKKRKV